MLNPVAERKPEQVQATADIGLASLLHESWAKQGSVHLLYLDESGCFLESPLSYGYGRLEQQKSIPQNKNRGRRINIMGVWEEDPSFEYALRVETYKAKNYVRFMNNQAERAMKRLFETGKYTVIVQDNASIHRPYAAKEGVDIWSKQGLIIFSLPSYSPEMNRIEDQWLYAKRLALIIPP